MSKEPSHPYEYDPLAIPMQDELTKWFYNCLVRQELISQENWSPFRNYYEFGVGWGGTMTRYLRSLDRFCTEYNRDPLSSFPIENNDAEKQYYLALSLHFLGENDKEALTRYDLALKYGHKPFWVYFNRGSLFYRMNENKKAYDDLKKAFELEPQNEGIQLMWHLVNKDRLERPDHQSGSFNNGILAHKTDYDPSAFIIEPINDIQKEKFEAAKWWRDSHSSYYTDFQVQTRIIISAIKKHPEIKSIFEFGCHSGRNLYFIRQALLDVQVFGIDINSEAIKIGKEKFDLPIEIGDEISLSVIPASKYDLVFTVSVIDHVVEPESICRELTRIAKKYIILLEPFFEMEGKITKMKKANVTEDFYPFSYSWDYKKVFSGMDVILTNDAPAALEGGFAGPYYRLYEFEKIAMGYNGKQ